MRGQVRQFSISEAILKNSFTYNIELFYMPYFDSCCVEVIKTLPFVED